MNWWKLRRKIHSSWLICAAACGVIVGVIGVQYAPQGWFGSHIWLVGAVVLMGLCLWSRWMLGVVFIVIAGGLLGLWRGSVLSNELQPYELFRGQQVQVSGVVRDDVERDRHGAMLLRVGDTTLDTHQLPGLFRVTLNSDADIKRGDRILVNGKLSEGFGGFAATMYRAELDRVSRPVPGDVARQVRDGFAGQVRQVVEEPAISLGLGYLLGQRRGLPEDLSLALQAAGLTHIVVASGYNLTILVRIMRRLLVRVSKYLATLAAGSMIIGFIAVTGMSPSMSRAGLVTGLALLAWYYGRRFHPLVLLPFAAAVTLLINPSYGWGDLGWQLSFAAFAGVMIVAPLFQRYFFGEKKPGTIRQITGETIAAFVVTLPILLVAFGQFSTVAIIANILVLPLVPLAMLLTFLAGVAAMTLPVAGNLIGQLVEWLLGYMIWVAQTLANLPWALMEFSLEAWLAGAVYVILGMGCIYMHRATGYSLRDANPVE